MSENLLKEMKIQDSGEKIGVQTLATRPNQPSVYGVGGLSADGLKKRFDKLADTIILKYNELCDLLGGADALAHIQLKESNGRFDTLADFFQTLFSGNLDIKLDKVETGSRLDARGGIDTDFIEANNGLISGDLTVDKKLTVWGEIKSTGNIVAPNVVVTNPENGKTQSVDGILQLLRQLCVSGYTDLKGNVDVRKNLTVYGASNFENTSMVNASAINMNVEASLTARRLSTEEDATIGGDLFVKGNTYTVNQQSVVAWDNIIVTNAFASETGTVDFLHSGLVIDKGDGKGYGILYKPSGDAVYIGEGTLRRTTDSEGKVDVEFTYDEGQALPLAARYGSFTEGVIPIWDAKKNAFISSGKTVGNIVEETLGDVDTALDHILAIQRNLIGGTA